jgi:opacity protein-like surface antigen
LRLSIVVLLLAAPCHAQTSPGWEVFGGYSWQRSNVRKYFKTTPIVYSLRNEASNLHGFDVSITENINRWFSGTLDISGHFGTPEISGVKTSERMYTVMYGPRFAFRSGSSSMTPFGHVLFGVAHMRAKSVPTGPQLSDTSFAFAAGGGLDIKLRNTIGIRVGQAEYLRADTLGANQNSFRISAGMILYLGE